MDKKSRGRFKLFFCNALLCGALLVPAVAQALNIGGVEIAERGRIDLRIEVPQGRDDPATFVPITVLSGTQPGPVLLMVAGVHGFEFTSVLAAQRLADEIDTGVLAGTLVIVRVAHVSAFENRVPYVNPFDRKNLNRSFPGATDGSQVERIAHALSAELISKADFVIDAHSGDGAEWLTSFVGVYGGPLATGYSQALGAARAMGLPNIVRYSMNSQAQIDTGRSLNRQAVAEGVPTLLVEIGENGRRDPENVAALVGAVKAAMGYLSMLPKGFRVPQRTPRYFDGTTSVQVAHSGLWHPVQVGGHSVRKGEQLGVIRNYAGAVVEAVTAPTDGFALYGLAGPPVRAGESVMTIARPTEVLD